MFFFLSLLFSFTSQATRYAYHWFTNDKVAMAVFFIPTNTIIQNE